MEPSVHIDDDDRQIPGSSLLQPEHKSMNRKYSPGHLKVNVLPMGASCDTADFEKPIEPEDIELKLKEDQAIANIDELLEGNQIKRVLQCFKGMEFDFSKRRTIKRDQYISEKLSKGTRL